MAIKREKDYVIVEAGRNLMFNSNIFLTTCWGIENSLGYRPVRNGLINALINTFTYLSPEDKRRWFESACGVELPQDKKLDIVAFRNSRWLPTDQGKSLREFAEKVPESRRFLYSLSASGRAFENLPESSWEAGNKAQQRKSEKQVKEILSRRIHQLSPWLDAKGVEETAVDVYGTLKDYHKNRRIASSFFSNDGDVDVLITAFVDDKLYAFLFVTFDLYDYDPAMLDDLAESALGIVDTEGKKKATRIASFKDLAESLEESCDTPIVLEFAEYLAIMGYVPITFANACRIKDPRLMCYNYGERMLRGVIGEDATIESSFRDEWEASYCYTPRKSYMEVIRLKVERDIFREKGISLEFTIGGTPYQAKRMLTASSGWNMEEIKHRLARCRTSLYMYVYEEGKKEPTVKVSLDRYRIQETKWSPAIAYDWNLERFLSYFRDRPEYLVPHTKEEFIELMGDFGPYGNIDIADKETIDKVSEKLEPVSNKVFGIPTIVVEERWSWEDAETLGLDKLIEQLCRFRDEVCSVFGIKWVK